MAIVSLFYLLFVGTLSACRYSSGRGYWPSGGLGVMLKRDAVAHGAPLTPAGRKFLSCLGA